MLGTPSGAQVDLVGVTAQPFTSGVATWSILVLGTDDFSAEVSVTHTTSGVTLGVTLGHLSVTASPCPKLHYVPDGARACSPCPPGRFGNSCSPCSPGTFASTGSSAACERCPPGTSSGAGQSSCDLAPAGRYISGEGATSSAAQPCQAGYCECLATALLWVGRSACACASPPPPRVLFVAVPGCPPGSTTATAQACGSRVRLCADATSVRHVRLRTHAFGAVFAAHVLPRCVGRAATCAYRSLHDVQ